MFICRIVDRANNGLYHVVTEDHRIVRLYGSNPSLTIGDFIYTTPVEYDIKHDDEFVIFKQKIVKIPDMTYFKAEKFSTPCFECIFRLQKNTSGCERCFQRKK